MSDARIQQEAVKPQQELRFTARDPILDEALASFETYGKAHSAYLPKNLYLFAMKAISIDTSDRFDGQSLNESAFLQYRMAVENVGNNGMREFPLEPWVKPLHAGGPNGSLVGVGLRVRFDPLYSDMILAPPLLGKRLYPDMPDEDRVEAERSNKVLEVARRARFLPVRYEIGRAVEDPTKALERLSRVLELGVFVTQLRIVPSYPRSARLKDLYPNVDPIDRTFERVDQYLTEHPETPSPEPISLSSHKDSHMKSAS